MKTGTKFIIGASAVLAGTALYKLMRDDGDGVTEETPFSDFLADQETVDELDSTEIAAWFRRIKGDGNAYCMVAYPTEKVLAKLGIVGCPPGLNPRGNVLQIVISGKTAEVLASRLISFSTVSDKVASVFGQSDYFIIEDN